MKTHELKTWPDFYNATESGDKTFELRKDDRGYRAGDKLILKEWLPHAKKYTGRQMAVEVTYLMSGVGLQAGWVAMAIKPIAGEKAAD